MGPQLEFVDDTGVRFEGKRWTFFGGNDYHRFSRDPEFLRTLSEAAAQHGLNTAGSRFTTANHRVYSELETAIAHYTGAEDALIVSAGYLGSIVMLQGTAPDFDAILLDETSHASLYDGARLSGKQLITFTHTDPIAVQEALASLPTGSRPLLATDGIFASIGDMAPLAEYWKILEPSNGMLAIDDAHAAGVIGKSGRGSWEEAGIPRRAIYQSGTFSKGLGGFGGFVTGDHKSIELIRTRSGAFKGSTPLPLPVAVTSGRAIEILKAGPERITKLRELTGRVKHRLGKLGFAIAPGPAPILSITYLDAEKNRVLENWLREYGIYPSFIDYPGSPPGGHFRFTLSSKHSGAEVEALCSAIEASAYFGKYTHRNPI